jgi:anti-sigma regulatory factor (Ser/Thr protein kinase)
LGIGLKDRHSQPIVIGPDIEATVTVIATPDHVADARHFVGARLVNWGLERVSETAVLLTSEVVSNAILHAGPHRSGAGLTVHLYGDSAMVRVEVADWSTNVPVLGDIAVGGLSGRGLVLLDALASSWGSTPNREGKSVWFEIAVGE